MNTSLLLTILIALSLIPEVALAGANIMYIQGLLRDQAPDTMKFCGSAGTANGTYGFVGTDFQLRLGDYQNNEKGLVGKECNATNGWSATQCGRIGADRTPVYAYTGRSPGRNVQSPASFYKWFHDSEQTMDVEFAIPLTLNDAGFYGYTNNSFFPLDGMLWKDHCPDLANPPVQHNYGWCFEAHFSFQYQGGESFSFKGDDDFWLFINGALVIDLGSLHQPLQASIQLDSLNIGMVRSNIYPVDLFYCERHTTESNIQIVTNILPYCAYMDWCGVCEGNGQSCCTVQQLQQFCDDGDLCTIDSCGVQVSPRIDGCVHTPVNCSSTDDMCHLSQCSPSTGQCMSSVLNCDDGNACTVDSCNSTLGCQHAAVNCDDSNLCTVESCDTVTGCSHQSAVCNDNNACTVDSCSPQTGCSFIPKKCPSNNCFVGTCSSITGCANTTVDCNDNNVCTVDSCSLTAGCQNVLITCNDHNACTADSCDVLRGCQYSTLDCNDHNVCTIDGCSSSVGCTHTPLICPPAPKCQTVYCEATGCTYRNMVCNDQNSCTIDSCNATTGQCSFLPVNCDDNNGCTTDSCIGGSCLHTALNCNDNNACTVDSCLNTTKCSNVPISCSDDNDCTSDSCSPILGCQHTAINCGNNLCATVNCDDDLACTIDHCDPSTGQCYYADVECNDNNACTVDSCLPSTGTCTFAPVACQPNNKCQIASCDPVSGCSLSNKVCNDGNPCTSDSCNSQTGDCVFTSVAANCAPCGSNYCTWTDSCNPQVCDNRTNTCQITPVSCNDNNACTVDSCQNTGSYPNCTYTVVQCASNNLCRPNSCDSTFGCVTSSVSCDDSNPCTTDTCVVQNNKTTCQFVPVGCDSSDGCNPMTCDRVTGQCTVSPVKCDDGNPCTIDSCVSNGNCSFVTKQCTTDPCHPQTCNAATGACTPLPMQQCDDGNPCTTDSATCTPFGIVCSHVYNNAACDDGLDCTVDYCNSSAPPGSDVCNHSPLPCPFSDLCTVSNTCVEGRGCVSIHVFCGNSTDFCTNQKCDPRAGCITEPRVCPNPDIGCYDSVCNSATSQCEVIKKSNFNTTVGKGGISCTFLYGSSGTPTTGVSTSPSSSPSTPFPSSPPSDSSTSSSGTPPPSSSSASSTTSPSPSPSTSLPSSPPSDSSTSSSASTTSHAPSSTSTPGSTSGGTMTVLYVVVVQVNGRCIDIVVTENEDYLISIGIRIVSCIDNPTRASSAKLQVEVAANATTSAIDVAESVSTGLTSAGLSGVQVTSIQQKQPSSSSSNTGTSKSPSTTTTTTTTASPSTTSTTSKQNSSDASINSIFSSSMLVIVAFCFLF